MDLRHFKTLELHTLLQLSREQRDAILSSIAEIEAELLGRHVERKFLFANWDGHEVPVAIPYF
jgi:predicted NAD-dependent protein-ADP-ribosyltransferase YbiA (DUF1768 family)